MLKNVYDHFVVLYQNIVGTFPELAAEDALRQEAEVYAKSTKLTYRNVSPISFCRCLNHINGIHTGGD